MEAATVLSVVSVAVSAIAAWLASAQARSAKMAALAAENALATGNEDAKLSAIFSHQQMLIDRYTALIESRDLAGAFVSGIGDPGSLDEAELAQLFYHLIVIFSHYETLYLAYRENAEVTRAVLGENWDEWSIAFKEYLQTDLFINFWNADGASYSSQFIAEIDGLIGGRTLASPSLEPTAVQRFIRYCKS